MYECASGMMGIPADKLNTANGKVFEIGNADHSIRLQDLFHYFGFVPEIGELTGVGYFDYPTGTSDDETGQGTPVAYYSYGALGIEAAVNRETGKIKLLRCGTWFDMGTQLNPKMCEGQSEGALMMGIGQVYFETEIFNDKGMIINANFRDYKIPTMLVVPFNTEIAMGSTGFTHRDGPYGAKGVGEVVLAPLLPAVANAINNSLGIQFNDIPINREALLAAIKEKRG